MEPGQTTMVRDLQPGQACLIVRDVTEADAEAVRSTFVENGLKVLKEMRTPQKNGLITIIMVSLAGRLTDVMLELAVKGVKGEIVGYESPEPSLSTRKNH